MISGNNTCITQVIILIQKQLTRRNHRCTFCAGSLVSTVIFGQPFTIKSCHKIKGIGSQPLKYEFLLISYKQTEQAIQSGKRKAGIHSFLLQLRSQAQCKDLVGSFQLLIGILKSFQRFFECTFRNVKVNFWLIPNVKKL